jgi:hypothetical protein
MAPRLSESALFLHHCSGCTKVQEKNKLKRSETNSARMVKVSDKSQSAFGVDCPSPCPLMPLGTILQMNSGSDQHLAMFPHTTYLYGKLNTSEIKKKTCTSEQLGKVK